MPFLSLRAKCMCPDSSASQLGHILFHWEWSSDPTVNVIGITEKQQNWELRNITKSVKLWKSGTWVQLGPQTGRQQQNPSAWELIWASDWHFACCIILCSLKYRALVCLHFRLFYRRWTSHFRETLLGMKGINLTSLSSIWMASFWWCIK